MSHYNKKFYRISKIAKTGAQYDIIYIHGKNVSTIPYEMQNMIVLWKTDRT